MKLTLGVVRGDGIGPEVVSAGLHVLHAVCRRFGHQVELVELLAGGAAIDATGKPLPEETVQAAKQCEAVILGAVGGPKWDSLPSQLRPERALLGLRAELKVYANLRPAVLLRPLRSACPLKEELIGEGFDILIVRELTGGIYFGKSSRLDEGKAAFDTEYYTYHEIERILRVAFNVADSRRKKLCLVDKANVLETSRLWREIFSRMKEEYPEIETSTMYVDNCAMQLVRDPGQFDVIATSNMFGDILSDEASMLTGSIGMLPSASIGDTNQESKNTVGLYEPIHGSAPDIAGKNIANPLGMILSVAMMFRYSFGLVKEAQAIEQAITHVLSDGWRTVDIAPSLNNQSEAAQQISIVGTREMGMLVAQRFNEVGQKE